MGNIERCFCQVLRSGTYSFVGDWARIFIYCAYYDLRFIVMRKVSVHKYVLHIFTNVSLDFTALAKYK